MIDSSILNDDQTTFGLKVSNSGITDTVQTPEVFSNQVNHFT